MPNCLDWRVYMIETPIRNHEREQRCDWNPLPVKTLTDYQEGSVVSRMIINKKAGTVTAFAFEKGEGLSKHSAPYDALVIFIEGEAEIPIGGVPHLVKEGDMLIMPAKIPHAKYFRP